MFKRRFFNFLNSSLVAVSVFIGLSWLNQIAIYVGMKSGYVGTTLSWDNIFFEDNEWDLRTILITYGVPFYLNLIIFLTSILIYDRTRRKNSFTKLYAVWSMFISYSWISHYLFAGFLVNSKFNILSSWLYLGGDFLFLISVLTILIVVLTSQIFIYPFLSSSSTKKDSESWRNTLRFLFFNKFLPATITAAIAFILINTDFINSFFFANLFLVGVSSVALIKIALFKPDLQDIKAQKHSVFDNLSLLNLAICLVMIFSVLAVRYSIL